MSDTTISLVSVLGTVIVAIAPSFSVAVCINKDQQGDAVSLVYGRFEQVEVQATQNHENPLVTNINFQKGMIPEPFNRRVEAGFQLFDEVRFTN